ncbi:MAG: CaiB/BaiF CoA-transferase family protein [Dehalococcoidia bacterium]|nr:CaiB/BaiF CoA-transferase family protein [Dehalococcoidia bacterium]
MLALEGIHIVEIGTHGPAAFCGGMLGDLGAGVVRVELPEASALFGQSAFARKDHDHAWQTANRNKQSIAVDLGTPGGLNVVQGLVAWADVLLEESLPGALRNSSLGYDRCRTLNSRLVYCSITAYGQDGPYSHMAGDDLTAQALGGYMLMEGNSLGNIGNPVQGPPRLPTILVAEHKAATHGAIAIMAALWHRRSSGQGQFIDISMLDGVVSQQAVQPMGRQRRHVDLSHGIREAKDGKYVALAAGEPWTWANLVRTLGGPEEYVDRAAVEADQAKAVEVDRFLADIFKTKTRDEWIAVFDGVDTEVTPVYLPEEVAHDPQMRLRQQQIEVTTVDGRRSLQYGIPMHLPETPGAVRSPAPLPGQDAETVLRQLGYDTQAIRRLREEGAVG